MSRFLTAHKYTLLTFLIALLGVVFFYHEVLFSPNSYLFSADGDGIKNYYTYLYHAKYDEAFSHFSGMNYPYFEHVVYTDAHPLLSWIIGKCGLVDYGIGILNLLILLSYPIAAVILFRIFKHYQVNDWWGIAGAVIITFMNPQVFRMTGHFSMAYVFAIPLMWWLLIKVLHSKPWRWSLIILLYLTVFFFTHPYLGMIMVFFGLVFWLIKLMVEKENRLRKLGFIGVQLLLPIIIFQGYVLSTDTHSGRLSDPAGFFDYYASWKSLLIAHDGPLQPVYSAMEINIGNWESWTYLGLSTIVFILILVIYFIRDKMYQSIKELLKNELVLFTLAAYLILLFAFCFPLKYDFLRWIADSFGPLKQFRILGRFAWIFYYVATVATIVGIYRRYAKTKQPFLIYVFMGGMLFSLFEFYPVHTRNSENISRSGNLFQPEELSTDLQAVVTRLTEANYDAVIFLPMQHMSSENIMLLGAEETNKDAFLLSYHGGFPLINSISSRMSLTEAKHVNNYFSPRFIEKELTYDIPEGARIAVVKSHAMLSLKELIMIWRSKKIMENETYTVYDFDWKAWNSPAAFEEVMNNYSRVDKTLEDGWKTDSTGWYYYESFDENQNTDITRLGKGAFSGEKQSWNPYLKLTDEMIPPGNYVLRYWYHIRVDRPDQLSVIEEQYHTSGKEAVWIVQEEVRQSTMIVGDWCMMEHYFTISEDMREVNFMLTGNNTEKPFIIDEVLIQEENGAHLYREGTGSYLIYDNYWVNKNSFQK